MNIHQLRVGTRAMLAALPLVLAVLTVTTSAVAQVAPADPTRSAVIVTISGTVNGTTAASATTTAAQEQVVFNNVPVEIGSTLSRDSDPTLPPVLIVDITFLQDQGIGAASKAKYIAPARVTKLRPLTPNAVIAITFPFTRDQSPSSEARTGLATFNLTFDANGVITGASGSIDSNTF